MLNTGKIYLHKILRNTVCWTLRRFIYTKYWGIIHVEHWEDLFTQNTEEYCVLNTVGRLIYPKYWGILYVEHCGKIYLHKILRNTLCWALWEDLFTQNTEEYFMFNTVRRFIYTKYWEILYVEHCVNIYLHTILGITLCGALWEKLTQNTGDYFMLNSGKNYLHKILRNTVCWALWEYLCTQNTGDYFMLNTVGIFMYTKYWGLLYVEHCGKIYLHKILRNTVCWTLWEDLFTQNTEE